MPITSITFWFAPTEFDADNTIVDYLEFITDRDCTFAIVGPPTNTAGIVEFPAQLTGRAVDLIEIVTAFDIAVDDSIPVPTS